MFSSIKRMQPIIVTIALSIIIVSIAAEPLIAGQGSKDSKIYVRKYRLWYPDQKISLAIAKVLHDEFADPPPSFFSKFRLNKKIQKPKTYIISGTSTELKVFFFVNESKQKQVDKIMKEKFGKVLRPEKLYDLKSVATIDAFAENIRKITKEVFTRQKFIFLSEQDIDAIAADLGEFVKTYTRSDVPNELRIRILDALDMYLYSIFNSGTIAYQERAYLDFDGRIKSLKMRLWQVIAKEPLNADEKRTFEKQKKWIYDRTDTIVVKSELEKAAEMNRVTKVFEDVLNGFSLQPMRKELFEKLKEAMLRYKEINYIASIAASWSTKIGMDAHRKYSMKERNWEFPFGAINKCGSGGVGGGIGFDFVSEKPDIYRSIALFDITADSGFTDAYDITTKRRLEAPDDIKTREKLLQWIDQQDKGDFYYDQNDRTIICCRGARMAVLDVYNFIESDKVPTEKLIEAINANPITQFSAYGYKGPGDTGGKVRNNPLVPLLAIESKTGEIAVISLRGLSVTWTERQNVIVRHRFDGWDKLWFDSFITGKLKESGD